MVIGDGELAEPLQALARELNIENHVLFCGWVLDRAKIFSDLDATCLSSYNEGSPVCLIESLAAEVPVIATRVGGVADVVSPRTDGELVESGNDEAFCAAMLKVARGRQRSPKHAARKYETGTRFSASSATWRAFTRSCWKAAKQCRAVLRPKWRGLIEANERCVGFAE